MENSLKGLILAAGTIITCVVITLGFYISKEARETASNGTNRINKLNSEFAESDKLMYDGAVVSGSEVISVIKRFAGESVGIYVSTGKSNTFYGYGFDLTSGELKQATSNSYTQALSEGSSLYINPYANFHGSIVRDGNKTITGIKFEQ